jgi:transcription antitermination factor NusG
MMGLRNIGDFVDYIKMPQVHAGHPWHLVQVNGGSEGTISDYLRRNSFDVYAPLTRVLKPVPMRQLSHKQRQHGAVVKKPKLVPLFPSYLFVAFDMGNYRWHDIFKLRSVRGLVCADDLPAMVPAAMVEKLKASEIDGAVPGTRRLTDVMMFDVGDRTSMIDGPFAGFPAVIDALPKEYLRKLRDNTIEELDESMSVTLLVSIFGRATPVTATIGQIEKR